MGKIFDDERINAALGRAMRNTVVFAWLFTLIYTVAVVVVDTVTERDLVHATVVDGRFVLHGIMVEVLTLIGGAIILLVGELGFLGSEKDEMKAYKKNTFYTKGFYAFVYVFACAYCVHVALNLYYDGYGGFPGSSAPYGFFPTMLIGCGGLFLMFNLKKENVMLNFSRIEDGGKPYFKKVFSDILKFGTLCVGFTVFALLLFILLSHDPVSPYCLIILLAGLGAWLMLSLEYLLLSIMEILSEKAQQKGRISLTTLVTFLLAAIMSAALSSVCIYCNFFCEFNSVPVATFYSFASILLQRYILQLSAFFVMYFCSETKPLRSAAISRSGNALVKVIIANICFDIFFAVIKCISSAKPFDIEGQRLCQMILIYIGFAADTVFTIAVFLCLVPIMKTLAEKKLLPRIPTALTFAFCAVFVLMDFLYALLMRTPFDVIALCLLSAIFIFFGVYVIKCFRSVEFEVE